MSSVASTYMSSSTTAAAALRNSDMTVHFCSVYELAHHAHSLTATAARVRAASSNSSNTGSCSPQHQRGRHMYASNDDDDDDVDDDDDDASDATPLTTLDKRELSKIVLRDAVYAQLLDVVPSRQHITTTLYTTGATTLRIDGVVRGVYARAGGGGSSADGSYRDGAGSRGNSSRERDADDDDAKGDDGGALDEVSTTRQRETLVRRVAAMACDATWFAAALRPYLGAEGCVGCLTSVRVDGLELLLT